MIKIQLGELKDIAGGLNEILSKELPIKPAYWFGKLAKEIRKELLEFDENRMNLVKKYASRDEHNELVIEENKYKFNDISLFNSAFKELADTEIEIDFTPISLDQLGDVKISPMVMMGLEKFIEGVE